MGEICICLVVIVFNVGISASFIFKDRLRRTHFVYITLSLFFLILALASLIYGDPYLYLLISSLFLLVAHLMIFFFFKLIAPMVFPSLPHQKLLKSLFNYFLMAAATIGATLWQILLLYDLV